MAIEDIRAERHLYQAKDEFQTSAHGHLNRKPKKSRIEMILSRSSDGATELGEVI